jgi:hypothetical protein
MFTAAAASQVLHAQRPTAPVGRDHAEKEDDHMDATVSLIVILALVTVLVKA